MTRTFNTRMVFRTMGALLLLEAIFMTIAMGVSLWYGEADTGIFLISTIITLLAGIIGLCIGRRAESRMGERGICDCGYGLGGILCFWTTTLLP